MHELIFPFLFLKVNYPILAGFAFSTMILAISPGPDNIFVLTQSLIHGVKAGLFVVLGLCAGCLIHTSLLAFGVSEIIKRSETLFWAIKIFGVIYLLYLAFQVYRSESNIQIEDSDTERKGTAKLFWTGFTMNVLNPKVTIFFLAFFPGFLFSDDLGTVLQFYVLGFVFIGITMLVFGGISLLSGSISASISQNPKAGTLLKWLQIIVFLAIALYLILSDK